MPRKRVLGSEVAFSIDLDTNAVVPLSDVTLAEIGIRERRDLQRWIEAHPEIVGPDLLVITTEFDEWEVRDSRVADRLDVLFLDSFGALLVAELKRDQATDTVDSQALKYAAYCSQLRVSDVVEMYARSHEVSSDEARREIFEHAPAIEDEELGQVRVRLVAGGFGPSITSVVLWLHELGLDIGCVEVKARRLPQGGAVLSSRQLLPPPVAEDYLVRRRLRREEDQEREARSRRRDSISILLENDAVEDGAPLTLKLDEFRREAQEELRRVLEREPAKGQATWVSDNGREALRWAHDGQTYSPTTLVKRLYTDASHPVRAAPGPRYWQLSDGRTLAAWAIELEPDPV